MNNEEDTVLLSDIKHPQGDFNPLDTSSKRESHRLRSLRSTAYIVEILPILITLLALSILFFYLYMK